MTESFSQPDTSNWFSTGKRITLSVFFAAVLSLIVGYFVSKKEKNILPKQQLHKPRFNKKDLEIARKIGLEEKYLKKIQKEIKAKTKK